MTTSETDDASGTRAAEGPTALPGSAHPLLRFAPLGFALLCVQLDFFSLSLALPTIAADLKVPVTSLQWLVSGYLLSLGAFMVPAGRLGDIVGRRTAVIVGLAIFAVTSFICGASTDVTTIIAFRVVQGVGAALIMPNVFALVAADTAENVRARTIGFLLGVAGVGTALGPIVGGVFAATVGWQWVFWVNVPLALIALVGAVRVRDSRDESVPRTARSMDARGLVCIVAGLASVSLGIDAVPSTGWLSPLTLGLLAAGVVLLALFALVENRSSLPLVRPSLLTIRPYAVLVIAGIVSNVGLNVFVFVATLDLQVVRGETPQVAGLTFLLGSVGVALAGPVAGWLCSRFPVTAVLGVSNLIGAVSLVFLALASDLWVYVLALGFAGLCCGMSYAGTQIGIQSAVPTARVGEANSFLLMALISVGGVAIVIASGAVKVLGGGAPTAGSIGVVLVVMAVLLTLAGGAQLAVGRVLRVPTRH